MAEKKKNPVEKKIEKQLIKILAFFAVLVIVFLIATQFFQSLSEIKYEDITFKKVKYGDLTFYHHSYSFQDRLGRVWQYNLYLRNDPRYNEVPIEANNPINFDASFGPPAAVVTIDTTYLNDCRESFAAIGTLSKFLADNQIEVTSANMDFIEAKTNNQKYATCEIESNSTANIIQIMRGNETEIFIDGQCHTITIGDDCQIMQAIEKYELKSILDARERTRSS